MTRWLIWAPFAGFAGLLWLAPNQAERTVRAMPTARPLPAFSLPPSVAGKPGLDSRGFATGEPRLLNVFASWCVPCIAEAPQLMALKRAGVKIDAIAIRDTRANVARFLARHGDPYERIGDDRVGAAQLALGSSGVPETFVIDGRGRIVKRHIGDIRADEVAGLIAELKAAR